VAYCIVAASHVSKKGADEFVKKLQAQGYTSARVHINKNVRRVVFGNYPTEAEAYNQLHKVHQNQDLAEAWVYEVKE
jgi:cell division septation protein DedD